MLGNFTTTCEPFSVLKDVCSEFALKQNALRALELKRRIAGGKEMMIHERDAKPA